jgi:hypothetical protein
MSPQTALRQEPTSETASSLDSRRCAPWPHSNYFTPVWTVIDSRDASRTATIDFRVPLADGLPLLAIFYQENLD